MITDLTCYISVGEAAEGAEKFEELEDAFIQSFQSLADGFFSNAAYNISEAFRFASENPLCILIVSCILAVLAFHLVPMIFHIFIRRW